MGVGASWIGKQVEPGDLRMCGPGISQTYDDATDARIYITGIARVDHDGQWISGHWRTSRVRTPVRWHMKRML